MAGRFSLAVDTPEAARQATKAAAIAGFVSVGLTVFVVLAGVAMRESAFAEVFSPWALLDAAVMAALSYGTLRRSRLAAVGLLVVFVVEQVALRVQTGEFGGLALAVVFTLLFVQGARGAFALHRMTRDRALTEQVEAIEQAPPPVP